MVNQTSEVGDGRPVAACSFSPDGAVLATGAWSGKLRLWSTADSAVQLTVAAHSDRITGAAAAPAAPRTPCRQRGRQLRQPVSRCRQRSQQVL